MTLQSSGSVISLSQIAAEFGGSAPHSMSEYYKNAGLVPSTATEAVTASSLGGSNSTNYRYPAIGGYDPQINTQSRLYTQALWGDNGSTITMDRNFTVNKTGTYNYYVGYYIQGSGTATVTMYVNGSQVRSHSLSVGYNTTTSATNTLSVSSGQVIRTVGSGPSSGWAVIYVYVGGSSYNNSSITISSNSSVPTSNLISMSNFYGASA
tara:strand:+ start:2230 stop:2853 length:624 start_codon:yes stop_codon:yes gene_type:complete